MAANILYIFLALLGLSFLIFIHELAHYIVARRCGMRVEIFSIGFGKPFFTWMHQGVKWQLCYLIFGGYVKIAGMEREQGKDPHDVPDGFYGKKPGARIAVALAGPIVNIVFAIIAFSAIWMSGGREKPFSEFTGIIGAVDPQSALYEGGVRAGDRIETIDGREFESFRDLTYASVVESPSIRITGEKVDYYNGVTLPFAYNIKPYSDPRLAGSTFLTTGVLAPASYLVYAPSELDSIQAPMAKSGIQGGDRVVWVDGELVFSIPGLSRIVNESVTLLTVKRGKSTYLAKVPRMKIADLRLRSDEKAQLDDWHYEMGLKEKVGELYSIPYLFNSKLIVDKAVSFINESAQESTVKQEKPYSQLDLILRKGDRIIAVDGVSVANGGEFLSKIQKRRVQMIVQRSIPGAPLTWKNEDRQFVQSINWNELSEMVASLSSDKTKKNVGDLYLLNPVTPVPYKDLPFSPEYRMRIMGAFAAQEKEIQAMKDPKKRELAQRLLEEHQNKLSLGLPLADKRVIYNPSPFQLCKDIFDQTVRTLSALVTGKLSPKWMSGPVGMVQIIHHGWSVGVKEALYWMGAISLSLGLLNLLPLPVLDGGHVCFALYEKATKRQVSMKAMEQMIIPFVVMIVAFFIYLTYNDLSRLFHHLR